MTFYADVERLNPVDWRGIKNPDGTPGTVSNTGNTQYNSRGEEMKIYTGSWTSGNAESFIKKSDDLVVQDSANLRHSHPINSGNTSSSGTKETAGFRGESVNTGAMNANANHSHDMLVYTGGKQSIANVYGGTLLASNMGFRDSQGYLTNPNYGGQGSDKYIKDSNIDHYHSVTASGYLYGDTDSSGEAESRPFNFTVKVWKRIA